MAHLKNELSVYLALFWCGSNHVNMNDHTNSRKHSYITIMMILDQMERFGVLG